MLTLMSMPLLTGCGASESQAAQDTEFEPSYATAKFHPKKAVSENGCSIDVSAASKGYVAAKGTSKSGKRLKLVLKCGDASYNYDMDPDGETTIAPLNMGDGLYTVAVMQNTTGSSYVMLASTEVQVSLSSEQAPFLRPNVFCDYDKDSACVRKAAELAEGARSDGEVANAIYEYIVENVEYDMDKADELIGTTGYVPDPDETLETGKGICLDYASLGAAMLRSVGIPCKIVTGYVSPSGAYHAWNVIWINNAWESVKIPLKSKQWNLADMTYAAAGSSEKMEYTDRYTY